MAFADDQSELKRIAAEMKRLGQTFRRFDVWASWTLLVDVSGFLDGEFREWPAHIQDPIYAACERDCKAKPGETVRIVIGRCYQDAPDEHPYLMVVAQAFPVLEH